MYSFIITGKHVDIIMPTNRSLKTLSCVHADLRGKVHDYCCGLLTFQHLKEEIPCIAIITLKISDKIITS